MKKIIITSAAAFIFGTGFVSCKKDYNCHCQKTSNAGEDHYTIRETKKKAANACENIKTASPSLYSSCVIE